MQKIILDKNAAILTSTGYVAAKDLKPFDEIRCIDGTERRPQVLRSSTSAMMKLELKSRPSVPLIVSTDMWVYSKRKQFHFGSEYRELDQLTLGQFLESTVDDGLHITSLPTKKSKEFWEMVGMLTMRGVVHSTFIEDEMSISLKLLDRHIENSELMGAFERAGFGRWVNKSTCTNTAQVNEFLELMMLPEIVFTLDFEKRKSLLKGLCAFVTPHVTNGGRYLTYNISSSNWALLTAVARLTASITGTLPKITTKEYPTQIGYAISVNVENPCFIEKSITQPNIPVEPIDEDELFTEISEDPIGILDEIIGLELLCTHDVISFIINTNQPIIVDNFSMCTLPLKSITQGIG